MAQNMISLMLQVLREDNNTYQCIENNLLELSQMDIVNFNGLLCVNSFKVSNMLRRYFIIPHYLEI